MFSKATFKKRRKFDYYMRFPSFSFLEEKPPDFISCSIYSIYSISYFIYLIIS